ncbi:hypothetical protein ABZW96_33140 [Nocardia sp. NPDC004168]|uniref:hypothetical protein n=1 Tax=Nocardia sp. NPDC004168 TaxID=3154452 RepID=UPI0033B65981
MFRAEEFYALRAGIAPRIGAESDSSTSHFELRPHLLGRLRVTGCRIAARSPRELRVNIGGRVPREVWHDSITVFGRVPTGLHEVWLTLAAPSGEQLGFPAYLSVLFDDSPRATIEPWIAEGGAASHGQPADSFVYVDNCLFGLMDADAADDADADEVVAAVGEHLVHTQTPACVAPLSDPELGDYVVVCRVRNGIYPVLATRNTRREVTGLHIDFAIVGPRSRKDWWKARHIHAHP